MTTISRRTMMIAGLSTTAAALLSSPAVAQTYPQRPLRIVVPFAPGGASDTLARIAGEMLRDRFGQTVVVENRPGGNAVIGMLSVASAAPDGYTLVQGHIGTHAISPAITPPTGYDVAKSFTTVAVPATSSNLLVVRTDSKIDSFKALIETAKAKPGSLNYGSPGVGSPSHIAVVQLAAMTGINVVHIAYRGNAAAVTDLLGGSLDFMFASPAEVLEHVKAGKMKALAASGAQRTAATPDILPLAEQGVPGYDFRTWHVISMRADTPPDILAKMRGTLTEVTTSDAFKKRLADLSLDSGIADGIEADKYVRSEIAFWGKFVKDAGIRAE
jgi:tripartite-type tricarboxylate transporter receptor subunit TctC